MDSTSEEDRRVLHEMVGLFGPPAFIRRARLVETSWIDLLASCESARKGQLAFVGLRLAQLLALADGWEAIRAKLADHQHFEQLTRLHEDLQPRLQLPLERTSSARVLRSAGAELVEAMEMFNQRWSRWLAKLDLSRVNKIREDYNRYYLFEKECAVGNVKVARLGFKILEPVSREEVERLFPLLVAPEFI